RIDGDNVSPVADREVKNTVDHEWRRLAFDLRPCEVVGPPGPHNLQVFHVVAGDLIKSRIPRAAITAKDAPLSIAGGVLRDQRRAEQRRDQNSKSKTP